MSQKGNPFPSSADPEDIDKLLDHVEKDFLKTADAKTLSKTSPKDCPCSVKHPTDWNEVDEMLKDFKFEDSNPYAKSKNKSWARQDLPSSTKEDSKEVVKKCFRVYLAGSYEDMGLCISGSERPCNTLKCLRCDFTVLHFDNFAWHDSTDYLFLRNNMPDFERLAAKLVKKKGSRAYGCQCYHATTSSLTNILSKPQVRWVCGGH